MDGANGSTTITDATGLHSFTVSGNTNISTAQSKFGGASVYLDGSGDWINGDGSSDFTFGTGDFTIDFWFRMETASAYNTLIDFRSPTSVAKICLFNQSNGVLQYYSNNALRISGFTGIQNGQWYHVAIVRSSNVTKLYLNGSQEGSQYNDTENHTILPSKPWIGNGFNEASPFKGHIDEFRIVKGRALWTSNFTPPTAPSSPDRFSSETFSIQTK
jgi:hypothetical protein